MAVTRIRWLHCHRRIAHFVWSSALPTSAPTRTGRSEREAPNPCDGTDRRPRPRPRPSGEDSGGEETRPDQTRRHKQAAAKTWWEANPRSGVCKECGVFCWRTSQGDTQREWLGIDCNHHSVAQKNRRHCPLTEELAVIMDTTPVHMSAETRAYHVAAATTSICQLLDRSYLWGWSGLMADKVLTKATPIGTLISKPDLPTMVGAVVVLSSACSLIVLVLSSG